MIMEPMKNKFKKPKQIKPTKSAPTLATCNWITFTPLHHFIIAPSRRLHVQKLGQTEVQLQVWLGICAPMYMCVLISFFSSFYTEAEQMQNLFHVFL